MRQFVQFRNPDSTDLPSFLGQNYDNRDCTRVFRSLTQKIVYVSLIVRQYIGNGPEMTVFKFSCQA